MSKDDELVTDITEKVKSKKKNKDGKKKKEKAAEVVPLNADVEVDEEEEEVTPKKQKKSKKASSGEVTLSFSGSKSKIESAFRSASRFSSNETGAPEYMKSILIEAQDDLLRLVAESAHDAIQIDLEADGTGIGVHAPGRMLIKGYWINTALSVIQQEAKLTFTYNESESLVTIKCESDGLHPEQTIEMRVPTMTNNASIPSIGEPDDENRIEFAPEAYAGAFNAVAAARNIDGKRRILAGVMHEVDQSAGLLRLTSSDGSTTTSTDAVEIDVIGEGVSDFIGHHASMGTALSFIGEGNKVLVSEDSDGRLHIRVNGRKGAQPYHIRVATEADVSKYPAARLKGTIQQMVDTYDIAYVHVDKAELQRLMRSASTIGSLDPSVIGGQAKKINLTVDPDEGITVSVVSEASYHETTPFKKVFTDSGESVDEFSAIFNYGPHSGIVDAYTNPEDPSTIKIAFIQKPGSGEPIAMILHRNDDGPVTSDGELVDYLSLVALSVPK